MGSDEASETDNEKPNGASGDSSDDSTEEGEYVKILDHTGVGRKDRGWGFRGFQFGAHYYGTERYRQSMLSSRSAVREGLTKD